MAANVISAQVQHEPVTLTPDDQTTGTLVSFTYGLDLDLEITHEVHSGH